MLKPMPHPPVLAAKFRYEAIRIACVIGTPFMAPRVLSVPSA